VRIALIGGPGGEEPVARATHLGELADALTLVGHDVALMVPDDGPCAHRAFTGRVAAALSRRPFDLVHSHGWLAGAAALEAADGTLPLVHSYHGLGTVERRHRHSGEPASPPERLEIERILARRATLVLASCVDEQRELLALGTPRHRVEIVPEGIDGTRFRPGAGSHRGQRPRILALGRPQPRRGIDIAITAMRHLPDAELLVVGGSVAEHRAAGLDLPRLHDLARRHLVEDRVSLRPGVAHDEVPALLRSVDVLVATPWYEGFGRVVVEAMACGVPVVAASVGGMLDTVQHGRTGLLVPARDPRATAGALRSLLADPVLRHRMGTSASAWAHERYAWPRVAEEVARHYLAAVGHDALEVAAP
jgi:glycosyltransferase involved in cell wall biosynthesis